MPKDQETIRVHASKIKPMKRCERVKAKEYLRQYDNICRQIEIQKREIEHLEDMATSVKSGLGDGMPRSNNGNVTERIIVALATAKADARQLMLRSIEKRNEIVKTINKVERAELSRLLYDKYIERWEWQRIADDIDYSLDHTKGYLHAKALAAIEEIINTP